MSAMPVPPVETAQTPPPPPPEPQGAPPGPAPLPAAPAPPGPAAGPAAPPDRGPENDFGIPPVDPRYGQMVDTLSARADALYDQAFGRPLPTEQHAAYTPPNKTSMIISGLLTLLFPGSKVAGAAGSYMQGALAGSQQRYGREETAAGQDYQAQLAQRQQDVSAFNASETRLGTALGISERADASHDAAVQRAFTAHESVEQRAEAAATRAQTASDSLRERGTYHLGVLQARNNAQINLMTRHAQDLGFKQASFKATLERLTNRDANLLALGQAHNAITVYDAQLHNDTLMKLGTLMEAGRNRRFATTIGSKAVQSQVQQINAGLRAGIAKIMADPNMDPAVAQTQVQQLEQNAQQAVNKIWEPLVAQHPELGGIDTAGTAPESENGSDVGSFDASGSSLEGIVRGAVAGAIGGSHPGVGAAVGDFSGENTPLPGHGTAPPAAAPGGAAPPKPAEPFPGHPNLGHGAGVDDAHFKPNVEFVSQHASEYKDEQALLHAIAGGTGANQLSQPQVQQLLDVWKRTRTGQGTTPPGATPPPAKAAPAHGPGQGALGNMIVAELHGNQAAPASSPPAPAAKPFNPAQHAAAPTPPGPGVLDSAASTVKNLAGQIGGSPPAQAIAGGVRNVQNQLSVGPVIAAAQGAHTYGQALHAISRSANVDPALLESLVLSESSFSNTAISKTGAKGLGQLMPDTAKDLGVDPSDPVQNMAGTAVYLKRLLEKYHSIPLALAAYNAGPGAVDQHRGIPPFPETQAYVRNVMARYAARRRQLQQLSQGWAGS